MLGALTVAVIANGLILAHMSPFLSPIVTGLIILVAIWLNFRLFRARRAEAGSMSDRARTCRSASRSGTVMTVLGPMPVEAMGVTLMHEHILLDASRLVEAPLLRFRDRHRASSRSRSRSSANCA